MIWSNGVFMVSSIVKHAAFILMLTLASSMLPAVAAIDMMRPATDNYNTALSLQQEAEDIEKKALVEQNEYAMIRMKKKAIRTYKSAIQQYKVALEKKSDFFQAYNGLGISLHRIGDHIASLEAFNRALEIKPNYPEALKNRGKTFLSLKYLKNAKATYTLLAKRYHPDYSAELMAAMKAWVNKTADHPTYSSNEKRIDFVNWMQTINNIPNQTISQL